MAQYDFASPTAAFSDAISQELLRREMQKRQDLLDSLKVQSTQADIADRQSGRQLQQRQQDLSEKLRTDALTQRQQEHDDALAAVAPPQAGMVGNVPAAFALPMDNTADTSGIGITAPTAGGSAYQAERRKASDATALEASKRDATSQDKSDQRDFQAQQNEMNRGLQLAIAHLSGSNSEASRALANQLKEIQVQSAQDKLDATRAATKDKADAATSGRSEVNSLASELFNDPALNQSTGRFDNIFPSSLVGSDTRDFRNRVDRLKSLLSLDNRAKLKGQGAISDKETEMLAKSATSLDLGTDEATVRRELQRIMQATGGSNATGPKVLRYNPATGKVE